MTRTRVWLLAALAVVVALAIVGSVVAPTGRVAQAARGGVAPVVANTLVCPSVSGGPGGRTTDMTVAHVTDGPAPTTSYRPVFGADPGRHAVSLTLKPSAVVRKTTVFGAVEVTSSGAGSGDLAATQTSLIPNGLGRGLLDQACLPPATDWWFAGADGGVRIEDVLMLVNSADAPANVALSFWSGRGPLSPPRTSGIVVPPHSTFTRRVSDFTPDVPQVAFHVHANSGTISAGVVDLRNLGDRPTGSDSLPPTTPPTTSSVITGFMPGAIYGLIDVLNPGDRDATVSLRVLTASRNFAPAGHQTVVVPSGKTVRVDLSAILAAEVAGVVITSDVPVTAAGMTALRPTTGFTELAWLPAQRPLPGPAAIAGNAPPFGQKVSLILTAPAGAAKLRLTTSSGSTATISVPAGRTINVDLRALLHAGAGGPGPLLFTPLDAPVYVVRTLYAAGAHGPLMAASAPMVLPKATDLPPVVADPRAALP